MKKRYCLIIGLLCLSTRVFADDTCEVDRFTRNINLTQGFKVSSTLLSSEGDTYKCQVTYEPGDCIQQYVKKWDNFVAFHEDEAAFPSKQIFQYRKKQVALWNRETGTDEFNFTYKVSRGQFSEIISVAGGSTYTPYIQHMPKIGAHAAELCRIGSLSDSEFEKYALLIARKMTPE